MAKKTQAKSSKTAVGIVGLGLIGGSLFKNLRKNKAFSVIGVSHSQKGRGVYSSYDVLSACTLVFVCTPMPQTPDILAELETILPAHIVVVDVCSLKSFLCTRSYKFNFIPSHPMAGTEFKGFKASFPTLFNGAKWAVCADKQAKGVPVLLKIIKAVGASPVFCSPLEHDKAVALISHMPMVVAQALVKAAQDNPLALTLAASGFRDMTRLALSNEEMAAAMVALNETNIRSSLAKLFASVNGLMDANYALTINNLKKVRARMYPSSSSEKKKKTR